MGQKVRGGQACGYSWCPRCLVTAPSFRLPTGPDAAEISATPREKTRPRWQRVPRSSWPCLSSLLPADVSSVPLLCLGLYRCAICQEGGRDAAASPPGLKGFVFLRCLPLAPSLVTVWVCCVDVLWFSAQVCPVSSICCLCLYSPSLF